MEIGYLQEVKAIIKSLVLSCPVEITVDALNRDYRSTEGIPIPHRKLGFQTLEEFLRSIPDTITVSGSGSTAIVSIVRSEKSDHIHQMVCQQKKTRTRPKTKPPRPRSSHIDFSNRPRSAGQKVHSVPKRFISDNLPTSNIRFNYSMNRTTPRYTVIKCQELELPAKYTVKKQIVDKKPIVISEKSQKATQQKITQPYTSEKCASHKIEHDTILQKLVNVCKIDDKEFSQRPLRESNLKKEASPAINFPQKVNTKLLSNNATNTSCLLKASNAYELNNSFNAKKLIDDTDEAVPAYAADNLVFRMDFPENTVTFGRKIPSYKLPEKYGPGHVIGLFISEIHSPYKFWFHIYKEHNELDTLMLQIERFYMSLEPKSFCIPRVCICRGQVCAALYKNLWHRAEILSPVIENKAKVLFVDYGTVSEVPVDDIKFLLTSFATLPQQAIRGSLSYIRPKNLHWSQESIHAFLDMTFELMLYGQISEIHEKKRVIYMVLCDTNKEQVVQINKQLVDKGFALYDEEWLKSEKGEQRFHHLREDFPTFSMLEAGEYPSFAELIDLRNKGIDYEWIIDHHIFHPGRMDLLENVPDVIPATFDINFLQIDVNVYQKVIIKSPFVSNDSLVQLLMNMGFPCNINENKEIFYTHKCKPANDLYCIRLRLPT